MAKHNQVGEINILLIPLILMSLLFVGAASFAYWAFGQRQDYKNNVDQKINVAVAAAQKATQATDAAKYAAAAKDPLSTYIGPEAYGSLHIAYPRTWSAYVDTTSSSFPVNGYFYPGTVPGINDQTATFALRVQVLSEPYSQAMQQYQNLALNGSVKIKPYKLPKVPSVVGSRVDGQITTTKQGSMVVLPLRSQTLEIWTESNSFLNDFDRNVLANSSFSP